MYTANRYVLAQTADEALALLRESPKNAVIGGGVWMHLGNGAYTTLIDLSRLGLDEVKETAAGLSIGAMVPLRKAETDERLSQYANGVLSKAVSGIVGVQLRNAATFGGSVGGRLGFSDVICALLALDAKVVCAAAGTMPLADFLTEKPRRDLVLSLLLPADGYRAAYEVRRLTATDIAILNVCAAQAPDGTYRVCVGARPEIAVRCAEAENALAVGDIDVAAYAVEALKYGTNLRGSAEYRRKISGALLRRAWDSLSGGAK